MKHLFRYAILCIIFILHISTPRLYGQSADTNATTYDTASAAFQQKVTDAGNKDQMRSKSSYDEGRTSIKQNQIINTLLRKAQTVKIFLDTELDLKKFEKDLGSVAGYFSLVQDGIMVHTGTAQTDRNLTVSAVILDQLINETQNRKQQLDQYTERLIGFRSTFDSLLSNPVIYTFPKDSVKIARYLFKLKVMASQGNPTDNALNYALEQAQELQNKTDSTLFVLKMADEQIDQYRTQLSQLNLKREFHNIWDTVGYKRDFSEIVRFSLSKEQTAFVFYIEDNVFRLFLLFLFTILAWLGIRSLRKHLNAHERTKELAHLLVMKRPLASAILIIFSIYQFAFIKAPFIFSFSIWTVQTVALLLILHRFITPFWFRFLLGTIILFLMACLDNFVLQASRPERWFMLFLALAGVVFCLYFLMARKEKDKLKEQYVLVYMRFLIFIELLSALLNILGRYNLSKTLLTAGYTGMVIAIMFTWTVRLINECLKTASELYHHPERKLLYLNFNRIGRKVPRILYFLLAIGWCIIVGRNFYFYNKVSIHFFEFLHKPRTIGDYTFAVDGLFLFVIITACSLLLSRLVSLFAADPNAEHASLQNRDENAAKGSWILLSRIAIITLGLFVAFAASGLPIDKITIVLGALSVGVGLGLQSLVSNLVSGLIIAFERPVNVGDQIEINGKSGMMKSIGFRSSVVQLNDGSCLVVPNGDLLSTHLVNWSISHNRRKLAITVNVDYDSDLEQVSRLLVEIAQQDERVLQTPQILAVAKQFGTQAILFDLVFWINNQSDALSVSGSVITRIHTVFKEKNIIIPHPQHINLQFGDETKDNSASGKIS
ncbi:mechanosensitive ion channel protein [Taibaiella sp. KBW10]|uniref:mechanosensitive ion channel family protein n=1 Tax=Taibaiella sp. KBW10 TaxID=2153357 RepID=UPI000F5AB362|nr:mechanosensitive ion channel domain-containing protein [Taibaiella sp. KBW10]RQO31132.1 mechanosensitive ion channel protein [Taibaiella sp. KBW10]